MPSLCTPVPSACSLHLQDCISSLSPLTAFILHHSLFYSLLHPAFMMTQQTGRRHSLDKLREHFRRAPGADTPTCDTNWLFSLHTTILCLQCSVGALPHLLAPASCSTLPQILAVIYSWFSPLHQSPWDSNSLLIASSGPRVSVAAAVVTNRVIKGNTFPFPHSHRSRENYNLGGLMGSNYCGL